MAHFRATIKGNRGEASRLGTKKSGIQATINGWNIGVEVNIYRNLVTNKDEISIWLSGGSNGNSSRILITHFSEKDIKYE